jgi:hypothetical protein
MWWRKDAKVRPETVIKVLQEAHVRFVVIGTHALNGWRDQSRATQDIDFLVRRGHHLKAINALHNRYPRLLLREETRRTRFVDPARNVGVIDLFRPVLPIFRRAFECTLETPNHCLFLDFEATLACKFAVMVSAERDMAEKFLDAGDFMNIVEACQDEINFAKLKELADLTGEGEGDRIARLVRAIRSGRQIKMTRYF